MRLSPATLRAVVEEFVTRDGTDHSSVDRRIECVLQQLDMGLSPNCISMWTQRAAASWQLRIKRRPSSSRDRSWHQSSRGVKADSGSSGSIAMTPTALACPEVFWSMPCGDMQIQSPPPQQPRLQRSTSSQNNRTRSLRKCGNRIKNRSRTKSVSKAQIRKDFKASQSA